MLWTPMPSGTEHSTVATFGGTLRRRSLALSCCPCTDSDGILTLHRSSERPQYRQHSIHSSDRSQSNFVEPGRNHRLMVERRERHQSIRSPHRFCQHRRPRPGVEHGLGERGVRALSLSVSRFLRYLLDWNPCIDTAHATSYSSDNRVSRHRSESSVFGLLWICVSACDRRMGVSISRTIQTSKIPSPVTSGSVGHREDEVLGKSPKERRRLWELAGF